jgi:LmbE family N-acetylglucosaminyl deacetylase
MVQNSKSLIFFVSHLDDFEISCMGYLLKHHAEYEEILCVVASSWSAKTEIWTKNLQEIERRIDRKISYFNLGFEQRRLTACLDDVKDVFYKSISFGRQLRFDIVTHDAGDCHTDHVATHQIAKGLYKYADRFVTIYSPSTSNFQANYWIGLTDEDYDLKKTLLDKYDINTEQSYTKLGYYLQSDKHYDIGSAYYLENFVHNNHAHHECYKILKWS